MDKKQTAVEWLIDYVNSENYQNAFGQTYISVELIEQAKQMEKEQIIDAICIGIQHFVVEFNEAKNTFTISYPDPNIIAKQYYNETYKP